MRKDIREKIKVELYRQGITVTDAAKQIGMSRTQLSRILNDENYSTAFRNWEAIAKLVGYRFELLLAEKENSEEEE